MDRAQHPVNAARQPSLLVAHGLRQDGYAGVQLRAGVQGPVLQVAVEAALALQGARHSLAKFRAIAGEWRGGASAHDGQQAQGWNGCHLQGQLDAVKQEPAEGKRPAKLSTHPCVAP